MESDDSNLADPLEGTVEQFPQVGGWRIVNGVTKRADLRQVRLIACPDLALVARGGLGRICFKPGI
jgi:hypothetical protein